MSTPLGRHNRKTGRLIFLATSFALLLTLTITSFSQQRSERTIEEIKVEAIHRAEVGQYPLIGLDPADVK